MIDSCSEKLRLYTIIKHTPPKGPLKTQCCSQEARTLPRLIAFYPLSVLDVGFDHIKRVYWYPSTDSSSSSTDECCCRVSKNRVAERALQERVDQEVYRACEGEEKWSKLIKR